jgi:hypothetical protein
MFIMAITFSTDRLQGLEGTAIAGVYGRIQSVTVKKYDTDPVSWACLYDVVLHATAVKRNADDEYPEWPNRLRSREIDHFTCTYDPTSDSNPYAQAYSDLKTKLAATRDNNNNVIEPVATSIADA